MADNTHETKIIISGDDSGAVGALNRVKGLLNGGISGALKGVRTAIARVMSALGIFGMAVSGIMFVVDGYKKLTDWMHRAAKAAAELRIAAVFKDAADSMDRLISRQETYNKLLKEELADLNRRKELLGIAQSGKEQRETEKREIARAKEIAGAANEDEERAIRQRWAEEDELRERGKRYRELKGNVAEETEKSAIYGSKANAAEQNVKSAEDAIADIRANFIRMNEEQLKEAEKQIEALEKKRKANAEAAAEYRKEEEMAEKRAELYRQQIEDVRNGGGVAKAKAESEKAVEARKKREADAKEQKTRDQNLEDKQLARRKEEALAELNPADPDYERQKKEVEYTYAAKELENKAARAENETDRQAAEEELKALNIRYGSETRNAAIENGMAVAERAASFDGVSQNRLTAMGLGSGVSASGGVASDVKKLVDLLKQQVDESKKLNEKDYTSGPATYAE